jgi:hypothetical protein
VTQEKGTYRRYARLGPGGWKCGCCAPPPGPPRRNELRRWNKTYNREVDRQVQVELDEISNKEPGVTR